MSRGRLVLAGQVIVDLVMPVPTLPPVGGDVLASGYALHAGGGFNVLAAAARGGAATVYAGAVGNGPFGDLVRAELAREGVAVPTSDTLGLDTGVCVVMVHDDGERTFVTGVGAESRLSRAHLAAAEVSAQDLVYVSGYGLLHKDNQEALLPWLPTLPGTRALLDPGPLATDIVPPVWRQVLAETWLLTLNATEARALTGVTNLRAAAKALRVDMRDDAVVIVRTGREGCLVVDGDGTSLVEGFDVTAVDTTGAGDTHTGVLAAELLAGTPLTAAAQRANAAAAMSVTRAGPATAPTRTELDTFVAASPRH